MQKIIRSRGQYAKKGEDIRGGDSVEILDEGEWVEGQFGKQFVVKIKTTVGEERNVNFNQTTINVLHDEFGEDTAEWVGRSVVIKVKKDVVAGKKVDIYYFVTPNWDFDEYRELVNKEAAKDENSDINAEAQLAKDEVDF